MQTIRIQRNEKTLKKILSLIDGIKENDVKVVLEDDHFISVQNYLKNELEKFNNNMVDYIELDELDNALEATISKYED